MAATNWTDYEYYLQSMVKICEDDPRYNYLTIHQGSINIILQTLTQNLTKNKTYNILAHRLFLPLIFYWQPCFLDANDWNIVLNFINVYYNHSYCHNQEHKVHRTCCKELALKNMKTFLSDMITKGNETQKPGPGFFCSELVRDETFKEKIKFCMGIITHEFEKNMEMAIKYFSEIMDGNSAFFKIRSMAALGVLNYENNELTQAKRYYHLVLANAHTSSSYIGLAPVSYNLANIYANENNFVEAEKHYKYAIDRGHLSAIIAMAHLCFSQDPNKYKDDIVKYLEMAIQQDSVNSLCHLGNFYKNYIRDVEKGEKYLKMAHDKGHVCSNDLSSICQKYAKITVPINQQKEEITTEIQLLDAEIAIAEQELELLKRKREFEDLQKTKKRRT